MENKNKMHPRASRANAVLSSILIVLMSVTIFALLVMGGMFILRISDSDPLPAVTEPTSKEPAPPEDTAQTDNLPATDAPTSQPTTDAPSADTTVSTPATDPATDPVTSPVTDEPDVPSVTTSAYLPETADGGAEYLKRVVFLGDSTTYHMHHYTDLDDAQIWVPASGTLDLTDITTKSIALPVQGVDYRDWTDVPITTALETLKPDILIVTLGVNFSTFYGKEEHGWTMEKKEAYFKLQISNIKKMVEKNSPDTTLIFQTIYPVIDAELIKASSSIRNEHINVRNYWLVEICSELNIPVLKTKDVLCDENGELKKEYNTYHLDGVHINPDGYEAILNYVRTHTVP